MSKQISYDVSDLFDQSYLRGAKITYENIIDALNDYQLKTNNATVPIKDLKHSIAKEIERISKYIKEF